MSQLKLFGGKSSRAASRSASYSARSSTKQKKSRASVLKRMTITLLILALLEGLYFFCVYTDNAFVSKWRTLYISTAMSTMSHQWLATAFIPPNVVNAVLEDMEQARAEQMGNNTTGWDTPDEVLPGEDVPTGMEGLSKEQIAFYTLFHELDRDSMESYLSSNPSVSADGYSNIKINEAGLNKDGTTIYTNQGDQVLAIDAQNQVLLVRVAGKGYRGVLAIAKDPSRLSVRNSSMLGSAGQTAGAIAQNNGGILAMTGSGFIDNDGKGNGGILAGYAMSDGQATGSHYGYGYKRVELRENDRMYIVDAQDSVDPSTRDAVEFQPALVVNGEIIVDGFAAWNGIQPRAAIGQNSKGEALMLVIEGRFVDSMGTDVEECANILKRYDAKEAMNLDGGTSAIMWYDGEVVTRCSNTAIPQGRTLPNAFVYAGT